MLNNDKLERELLETYKGSVEEHLQEISKDLIDLENHQSTEDREDLLSRLLEKCHTLKGTAGLFRQNDVARLAHDMEEVIEGIQQNRIESSPALIDLFLESVDVIARAVRSRLAGEYLDGQVVEVLCQRLGNAVGESKLRKAR